MRVDVPMGHLRGHLRSTGGAAWDAWCLDQCASIQGGLQPPGTRTAQMGTRSRRHSHPDPGACAPDAAAAEAEAEGDRLGS